MRSIVELARGLILRVRHQRARRLILDSGLFDAKYYRSQGPDLARGQDPVDHFLLGGWRSGLDPNRLFDTTWYVDTYFSSNRSKVDPLTDFIRHRGARNPGPLFDAAKYLADYPDVAATSANPLAHYLHFGAREGRSVRPPPGGDAVTGAILTRFESWLAANALSDRDMDELEARLTQLADVLPSVSVIMPVYEPDADFLNKAVASVRRQIFQRWELWLVNDGSGHETASLLDSHAEADPRVRVLHLERNVGISGATNAGAAEASGEILLFLDQDDELTVDCLAEMAIHFAEHPQCDIVYSDDDKVDSNGRRYDPQFKPDWSPVLLLSWMYLSHALAVRRTCFERLGGFRSQFDGAQDYDLALRAAEVARAVGHIPRILYHWRAIEGSTALGGAQKPASIARGQRALEQAIERRGIRSVRVDQAAWAVSRGAGAFELTFTGDLQDLTIVLELRSNDVDLGERLAAIRDAAGSADLLVCSAASDATTVSAVAEFGGRLINYKAADVLAASSSDMLLFLGADVEVPRSDQLTQLCGYLGIAGVGIVGSRIVRPDGTVAAAGQLFDAQTGSMVPEFQGLPSMEHGVLALANTTRECFAVSRRCLLTTRSLFEQLGGFADERLGYELAAADYCSRARRAGHSTVICSSVDLMESGRVTSPVPEDLQGRARFRSDASGERDPYYNPNLCRETGHFLVSSNRPPSAKRTALRAAIISHNLNQEGAANTLFDLVKGLRSKGEIEPLIISPATGSLRDQYQLAGVEVIVEDAWAGPFVDLNGYDELINSAAQCFIDRRLELVLANTLRTHWAVEAAARAGIPSLWAQHESEPWESYFDYLPPEVRRRAYGSFAQAYQVIFVSKATREAWRAVETRNNFKLIRHGVPQQRLATEVGRWTRGAARTALQVGEDDWLLCLVGTVCERKGQLDAIKAFSALPEDIRAAGRLYIVGAIGDESYAKECVAAARMMDADDRIRITGAVEDPFLYYRAADIALCTSRIESAPRVLVEAMACGLAIVTTPVFGIPEIVAEGVNAAFYDPGNVAQLANRLETLFRDRRLLKQMGEASPRVLQAEPGFEQMLRTYARTMREAAALSMSDFLEPQRTFVVDPAT